MTTTTPLRHTCSRYSLLARVPQVSLHCHTPAEYVFFFCLGTDLCFEFGHLLSAHESFCNLDNGRSLSPHEDSSHFSCSESVHQQKGQTAGTINPKVYYSFSETINSQYTGFCEFPSNQMLFEPVATLDGTTTHIVLGEGRGEGRAEEEDETMRRQ